MSDVRNQAVELACLILTRRDQLRYRQVVGLTVAMGVGLLVLTPLYLYRVKTGEDSWLFQVPGWLAVYFICFLAWDQIKTSVKIRRAQATLRQLLKDFGNVPLSAEAEEELYLIKLKWIQECTEEMS